MRQRRTPGTLLLTLMIGGIVPCAHGLFGMRTMGNLRGVSGRAWRTAASPIAEPRCAGRAPVAALRAKSLLQLTDEDAVSVMEELGQPKFRAKQLRKWIVEKGVVEVDEMKDLPKALRAQLKQHLSISSMEVAVEQVSKDGTRKHALRLEDGQLIEAVLMPYNDGRRTACISSQAGCAMGCKFCATGLMGFARQLSSDEIFEQAALLSAHLRREDSRLSNVVFMGMGEPLANFRNVRTAVKRINKELGIGARHITVSTVGIAPRIRTLADEVVAGEFPPVTLAVSLHASSDAARTAMMPINERYDIAELLGACKAYADATSRRISFEYALISGTNDSPGEAANLARVLVDAGLKGRAHVNAIPVNPTSGFSGSPSESRAVKAFIDALEKRGIPATVRMRRGIDIDAGCGQLKAEVQRRSEQAVRDADGEDADGAPLDG